METRFTARLLGAEDSPAWDRLWAGEGCALQHWHLVECMAAGLGRPVRVGVHAPDGRLVAGAAFVLITGLTTRWAHPVPAPFAGVMMAPEQRRTESGLRDVLAALAAEVARHTRHATMILPPDLTDVRALQWAGWHALPRYNYVSEIARPDALENAAENAARRQIRKASEAGLAYAEGDDLLPDVLALWAETRRRQDLPTAFTDDAFRGLLEHFPSAGPAEGPAALVAGIRDATGTRLLAGGVFLRDVQRLYYMLGGSVSDLAGEDAGAPSLLHARVTGAEYERRGGAGFVYDWVGANTPSVVQFKKRFRPALETNLSCTLRRGWAKWLMRA